MVAIFVTHASATIIDRNGNGPDDIWEIIYGAQGLSAAADTDGDGFSNSAESAAGTDPFDPNSHPFLQIDQFTPSVASFVWSSVPGKQYTLQSSTNLGGGAWSNELQVVAGLSLTET